MAGGAFFTSGNGRHYKGKVTVFVLVTCLVAAMGGLLFGYDLALVASFFASTTTRMLGHKCSMFMGSLFFLIGALLNGFAINVEMLIVGYCLVLGWDIVVPVYLSKMAPTKIRGALNMGFQMMTTIGILLANLINYGIAKLDNGWRIFLDVGDIPAILLCLGSLFLGDTPNLLIERGQHEKAKAILQKIRGIDNVDEEYQDLIDASEIVIGVMIALKFGVSGDGSFSKGEANLLLFFICAYVAAFAWSWGPLGWLVPSEICPLEG
ncbi:Sugar transport protein 10 [Spatholobus suberectus]|nr:Sugar transport protein 10 [Spatholobus suberectus]